MVERLRGIVSALVTFLGRRRHPRTLLRPLPFTRLFRAFPKRAQFELDNIEGHSTDLCIAETCAASATVAVSASAAASEAASVAVADSASAYRYFDDNSAAAFFATCPL